ncbi:MAG: hypothetical protein ABI123_01725 [Ginsengibacter sp.]
MNAILEKLKNLQSDCCVTIILKTHRTLPDNEKDPIVLKNLVKEAETRLLKYYDKSVVSKVINKINALTANINHRLNLESLVLFVNEDLAEYTRLPIDVDNRVVIDKTFATRDLMRAIKREVGYYILLLSRDEARLIEALSDKVVGEIDGFPMNHYDLNPVNRAETSIASRMGNLAGEFFNRVDKQLNEIYKKNPLPVIICTDGSNYPDYLNVADNKAIIEGKVDGNRMLEKPHQVIEAAWPVMKEVQATKNAERLSELKAAVNNNKFLTDYNEIWEAVNNGRGKTLFVKQGFFQPALLDNNKIKLVSTSDIGKANVDDIIDEMIEKILQSNGDAVFINGDGLDKFQGLALTTRY